MRPVALGAGACVMVLLVAALHDARRAVRTTAAGTLFSSASSSPGAPLRAVVVVQVADCTGNLRLLDVLRTPDAQAAIQLSAIVNAGDVADSAALRSLLPAWTTNVPIRSLSVDARRHLARLGHVSSPMLIVLDEEGRVRFITQSPRGPREFAGLRRIVNGLTWSEDR